MVSGLMRLIGPISCCIRRSWRSFSVSANLTTRLDDAPCVHAVTRTHAVSRQSALQLVRYGYNYDSTAIRRAFDCLSKGIKAND